MHRSHRWRKDGLGLGLRGMSIRSRVGCSDDQHMQIADWWVSSDARHLANG